EAAAQAALDMAADQALDREDLEKLKREDPDAAAKAQHDAMETLRRAAKRSEMGATVDLESIARLAAYDPQTVARIVYEQQSRGNRGGDRTRAVVAAMEYADTKQRLGEWQAEADRTSGGVATHLLNYRSNLRAVNRVAELDASLKLAESNPDILAAFQGRGGGWDKALAQHWDEMEKARLAALAGENGQEGPDGAPELHAGLRVAQTDSLGAQGIGYTGSPMQKTEELLREIRDDARARAKRPAPAPDPLLA
ncbi:MAG: hypothetical protein IJ678_04595, partial [Kiritimatiellae bacterium]|nr:hypothetical protein [Kiritimatiellia bacterium]